MLCQAIKSLASSSIATHLVVGVHQLSSSMCSVLNSAHLKLVGVVDKMGVAAHFSRALRAHIVKHPGHAPAGGLGSTNTANTHREPTDTCGCQLLWSLRSV